MTAEQFSSFLNRTQDEYMGQLVLLSDYQTAGDYMTHYFISQAIRSGHNICIVSLLHSFNHYNVIGNKLLVNLQKSLETSQLLFVDCLSHLLQDETDTGTTQESVHHKLTGCIQFQIRSSLRELYQLLKRVVTQFSTTIPDKPVCLVLDDISVLISLGVTVSEIMTFINHCYQLVTGKLFEVKGYMIVMSHDDIDDEDEHLLHTQLHHNCHMLLHMTGLETGYSKDIHGELTVQQRDPLATLHSTSKPQTHTTQYRILDRGIHLFAKGTSQTVL